MSMVALADPQIASDLSLNNSVSDYTNLKFLKDAK